MPSLYVRVPKLFDELALAHGDGSAGRRLKALGRRPAPDPGRLGAEPA